jgi:acetaldehyde dehydrogenase
MSAKTKAAVIGSGNIGTDLMIKMLRLSDRLEVAAMVGIDPASDGLARARRLGVPTTADGVAGLIALPGFADIRIVFDATSARAHAANATALAPYGVRLIDLTPAALGPFVVPAVNLEQHVDAPDLNMVTCGGQATIPIVAAVAQVTPVPYAEIVASIASKSAGPGTRANIDEFTETTASAIESVGGAGRGKAVIILNPAEPAMIMRDTVFCLVNAPSPDLRREIVGSIERMVAEVSRYVPGYRLKQAVQITPVDDQPRTLIGDPNVSEHSVTNHSVTNHSVTNHSVTNHSVTHQVSVLLEVEGAAHYLPAYAGNLDIMTSAALRVGMRIAARTLETTA